MAGDEHDDGVVHPGVAEHLLRLHDVLDGDRLVDVGAHDDLPEVRLIALHHVGQVQRILVGELEIQGGVLVARYAEADEVQIAFALTCVGGRPARVRKASTPRTSNAVISTVLRPWPSSMRSLTRAAVPWSGLPEPGNVGTPLT